MLLKIKRNYSPETLERLRQWGKNQANNPKAIEARKKNGKVLAKSTNDRRKNDPEFELSIQNKATEGKRNSKVFAESSRNSLNEIRYRPDVMKKLSKKHAERAVKYGIASCRRSTPCIYNDMRFRSISEARVAMILDNSNILWEYESKVLDLCKKDKPWSYVPDFYIPKENRIIEVKGYKTKECEYLEEMVKKLGYEFTLMTSKEIKIVFDKLGLLQEAIMPTK